MIWIQVLIVLLALGALAALAVWNLFRRMPGRSWRGALPPMTVLHRNLAEELRVDLTHLSVEIGERNVHRKPRALHEAMEWIEAQLREAGLEPIRHAFSSREVRVANIEVVLGGSDAMEPSWVVGAHYDTVSHSPGADDNGTAVVSALALARRLKTAGLRRTIRIVFFANEEAPYFGTEEHGAQRYVEDVVIGQGVAVAGMFCLETMGYYRDEAGTQHYPKPLNYLYPTRGDFIAFVGDLQSRAFLHRAIRLFRRSAQFPSEGAALPLLFADIARSDHLPFWQHGIPALMITNTANFRTPYYHTPDDTVEHIHFERLARVVEGLEAVLRAFGENAQ